MERRIQSLVIVGGGTAGWLAACVLAARRRDLSITLVEAPDIPTLGVGEGSWPTLRATLADIGIDEAAFLSACDASFKQGSRFDGWVDGNAADSYLHPFTPPPADQADALIAAWQADPECGSFADAMTSQTAACARDLAPRQRTMPAYAGALNYGYHLDAGKLAAMLKAHATAKLGVRHVSGRVSRVSGTPCAITALELADGETISGDFFVDCSGSRAVLIGGHCGIPWTDRSAVSPNDRALAVQVATAPDAAIASQTIATAFAAGWIWDIALPTRRGIGCVYASRHTSDDAARAELAAYVARAVPGASLGALEPRLLRFETGYRETPWCGNCVAIGQAAGFIEPLEASAIVMIELGLRALAENFPASDAALARFADRYNALAVYRWERIIDFLKLHYALSRREEPYWRAQRDPATFSPRLLGQLELWRDQAPSPLDFPYSDEVFSAASQQYILYGMGFDRPRASIGTPVARAAEKLAEVRARSRALAASLPSNRAYFTAFNAASRVPARSEGVSSRP